MRCFVKVYDFSAQPILFYIWGDTCFIDSERNLELVSVALEIAIIDRIAKEKKAIIAVDLWRSL
jgi:hypothetical protein